MNDPITRAMQSLDGLSVGDAFGELFFFISPESPAWNDLGEDWRWTDDTHMALSIVEVLKKFGRIEQDALAEAFGRRYLEEPTRGYAGGARRLLMQLATGSNWRDVSPKLFGGGSFGNGAAMRVAPLGAFFAGDPLRAAEQAGLSAVVTHAHPEGVAGAIAVAVAASLAAAASCPTGEAFIREVCRYVPEGEIKHRLLTALEISAAESAHAMHVLGTGYQVTAQDTVPFCVWNAAHHLGCYEEALWSTARGRGDCDTTCAIVGGIVALTAEVPPAWLARREPLPLIV
ncbi:MAG: ADP-ribosylglycohydrolase family protein [Geobacteraceae bacterium]|nr:ADP-ribosylglycohydrolase family protein [Geobacteraceae bacterium]